MKYFKTGLIAATLLLFVFTASAQLSTSTDYSSAQTLSATGETAKTSSMDVTVVNGDDSMQTVSIYAGVCSPSQSFQYTELAAGCVDSNATVSKVFHSPKNWIDCKEGSVSNGVCEKVVDVPAGESVTTVFDVDVPVTADDGVYDIGSFVVSDRQGVVDESHRSVSVGSSGGGIAGVLAWLGNFTADLFSAVF